MTTIKRYNSSTSAWEVIAVGAQGYTTGQLLGSTYYAPATTQTKTVTGNTLVAVDTTNLTVTFTAPASGAVFVELTGVVNLSSAGNNAWWGVATHNTVTALGGLVAVAQGVNSINATARIYISGLTSGTSYQYDWIYAATTGITQTLTCRGATTTATIGSGGPAIMRVLSA